MYVHCTALPQTRPVAPLQKDLAPLTSKISPFTPRTHFPHPARLPYPPSHTTHLNDQLPSVRNPAVARIVQISVDHDGAEAPIGGSLSKDMLGI